MLNVPRMVIALLVGVAGIIVFVWFFPSDQAKIKKQLKTLSELASKDSDEHPFIDAAQAGKIGDMFAESCRFEIPSHSMSATVKRENIPERVMMVRSQYSTISLKFYDINIGFPEKGNAQVALTAIVELAHPMGEPIREVHDFLAFMKKVEKKWYFDRIQTIPLGTSGVTFTLTGTSSCLYLASMFCRY